MTIDPIAADDLRVAARGALARAQADAPPGRLDPASLWNLALELGWSELGEDPRALVIVSEELGRAACGWPVAEVCAAAVLFHAPSALAAALRSGTVRPTLVDGPSGLGEAGTGATHGLLLNGFSASLLPLVSAEPVDGAPSFELCSAR